MRVGLLPPAVAIVREAAGGRVGVPLEGMVLVGVVFKGREEELEEERAALGFTGRKPLVDLLSRSEIGATVCSNDGGLI